VCRKHADVNDLVELDEIRVMADRAPAIRAKIISIFGPTAEQVLADEMAELRRTARETLNQVATLTARRPQSA